MEKLKTIKRECSVEFEEKKSKFIASVKPVFSKEELEKLGKIREYEYRRRNSGNSYGSSYSNGKSESYSKEEYNLIHIKCVFHIDKFHR